MSFHQCKSEIIEMENKRPAFWSGSQFSGGESFSGDIHLLAAAGLRQPIDQLIMAFQKQTGQRQSSGPSAGIRHGRFLHARGISLYPDGL